jgi:hypothetical protein
MPSNVTFRAAATQCWICSRTLVTVGRQGEAHLPCADDFSSLGRLESDDDT